MEKKPPPTHLIHYTYATPTGWGQGSLDVTFPAGWTPENRKWAEDLLRTQNPDFVSLTVLGATEYKRAVDLAKVQAALVAMAGRLDTAVATPEVVSIDRVNKVADHLRSLAEMIA